MTLLLMDPGEWEWMGDPIAMGNSRYCTVVLTASVSYRVNLASLEQENQMISCLLLEHQASDVGQ